MKLNWPPSFTLIEMMAASTVLSLVLLLLVGMQDQMSRAWTNANRRSDATREASAACRTMAADLSCLIIRALDWDENKASALVITNQGIPFLYSSNAAAIPNFSLSSNQPGAAFFFAVVAKTPTASGPEDYALVGYYIASAPWTNINGFTTTNYNLYRYYVPPADALGQLNTWFSTQPSNRKPSTLFSPNPSRDEILARNTCNLRITPYNRITGTTKGMGNKVTNGLNYQFVSGDTTTFYSGSKLQVEMSVYPDEYAQRIPLAQWTNSANLQRFARSFEFRVDIPRD